MAGGEIKNVLTLDASKFTTAIDKATANLETFDKQLKNAGKVSGDFEKSVSGLGSGLTQVSEKFKMLDKTVDSLAAKLGQAIGNGFDTVSRKSREASQDVESFGKAVKQTTSIDAGQWVKKYAGEIDKLAPAIKSAISSIIEFDRANTTSGNVSEASAAKTVAAKLRILESEKQTNSKIIADREHMAAEVRQIQAKLEAEATAKRLDASLYFGKNAPKGNALRGEASHLDGMAAQIGQELQQLEILIRELKWKNAEIDKGIQLTHEQAAADGQAALAAKEKASAEKIAATEAKEAARAAKLASDESARAARAAAAERIGAAREAADFERQQAQQIAGMWKGMAQMWAASKIEHGLKSSVDAADDMQRQKVMVQSLGYSPEHNQAIYSDALDMSKQLKFISTLDAIKSRMSVIASIGYDNAAIIDKTLSSAVKAANNLQQLGVAHGDMQNTIRNLYGVVEMRQQTENASAANATFDVMQKIILGTQGKVQTQDVETMMRRLGMGASQVSDQGLMKLAAIIDQFKVSGGEHGGGSAGVATVGTMIKMFQSYALGKGLSNEAVKEFSGAGVLNATGLNLSKDSGSILTDAKHAGLKDAALWLSDPVAAIQKIMPQIVAYTQKSENRKKYYEGRDINNAENQATAVAKYLAALGITTTASQGAWVAGDPRSAERIAHQVGTMNGEKSVDGVDKDLQKTYSRNVQEMKAALTDLKMNVGATLLPVLTDVLMAVNSIIKSASDFARNNPLTTQFTAIALSAGGVVLGVKGIVSMFGMFGGVSTTLRAVTEAFIGTGRAAVGAGAATEIAGAKSAATSASMFTLHGALTGAKGDWATYAKTLSTNMVAAEMASSQGILSIRGGLGLLGSTAMSTAKLVGKAFLRMIPLVGELLMAWDFANLIAGLEVGGHQIKDWMAHLMDWLVTKAENGFERVKDALTLGMNHAAHAAAIAANNKSYETGSNANGFGQAQKPDTRSANMLALDRINSPVTDPVSGRKWANIDAAAARAKAAKDAETVAAAETANDDANAKVYNAAIADKSKKPRQFEDLFIQSLANMQGKETIDSLKLGTIMTGDESYRAQAEAAFKEHWLGGQFDEGHDPSKRMFKKNGKGGNGIDNLDMEGSYKDASGKTRTVKEWLDAYEAGKKLEDQIKAVSFAKERAAAKSLEATDAEDRLSKGLLKETDAMRALKREFARQEANGASTAEGYGKSKADALLGQARLDAVSLIDQLNQKKQSIEETLAPDDNAKIKKNTEENLKVEREYKRELAALDEQMASYKELGYDQDSKNYARAIEDKKALENSYGEWSKASAELRADMMKTPLQKLVEEWSKTRKQIDQLSANWGSGFMNTFATQLIKGRADWKGFLTGMAEDVLKMQLNKTMGGAVESMFGGIGSWLKGATGADKTQQTGATDAAAGVAGGFGGLIDKAAGGLKDFWNSITGAGKATEGLGKAAVDTVLKTGSEVAGMTTKMTAEQSATTSLVALANAATAAAAAIGGAGGAGGGVSGIANLIGNMFGGADGETNTASVMAPQSGWDYQMSQAPAPIQFAKGGIMTNMGPLPLNMYAGGGVTNSPQVAIFGEAGPEAYVPLPDGRSIPVTLNGGNSGNAGPATNITVNLVNQSGMPVQAKQSGQPRFDGKQIILDVVLGAVTQPGAFRDGMKGALA